MNNTYLSTKEAAQLLHIDTSTLRKWHTQGRLDNIRIETTAGGHRRWNRDDLLTLAETSKDGRAATFLLAISRQSE
jgi:excisionase family DNA binding protein